MASALGSAKLKRRLVSEECESLMKYSINSEIKINFVSGQKPQSSHFLDKCDFLRVYMGIRR